MKRIFYFSIMELENIYLLSRRIMTYSQNVSKKIWGLKMVNHWQLVSYISVFFSGMPLSLNEQQSSTSLLKELMMS